MYEFKRGSDDLQPFDRGQHRNRRRYQGVAEKQRRTDDAERHYDCGVIAGCPASQRHQRQGAAFAIIVGAQQHDDILEGDDKDERPKNERKHPIDRRRCRTDPRFRSCFNRFAKGVKRARADIAIDDADASDRESHNPARGPRKRSATKKNPHDARNQGRTSPRSVTPVRVGV